MPKTHTYILGINAYDHDVSVCLLRDGELAFGISKERITRKKNATGFHAEAVDYCLQAEGITLDDVELIVTNCYVLPVPEIEERMLHQDEPLYLETQEERTKAFKHPLFLSKKVVTIS